MPYASPMLSRRSPSPSRPRSTSPHSNQNQNQKPSFHSLGRPGHRRSYSSQSSLTSSSGNSAKLAANESGNSSGAWGGLGALPRRHSNSATPTISKFRIGDKSGTSSDEDEDDNYRGRDLPPLKLKVQALPSFLEGVPFPTSSTNSPVQSPAHFATPNNPSYVPMTRPFAPTRTSSSPAVPSISTTPTPIASPAAASPILLSNGKPLRSSLKGSRVSSLLGTPVASPANSPRSSPVNSTNSSLSNSVVGSPITSPGIPGMHAPSFSSLDVVEPASSLLTPPAFSGHTRAQSAPSHPGTPGHSSVLSPNPLSPPLSPAFEMSALLSPRSVRFPSLSSDLEHVQVFRKEARPASLLVTRKERDHVATSLNHVASRLATRADLGGESSGKSGGEETETETETDRDYGYRYRYNSGYNGYWGSWDGKGHWGSPLPSSTHKATSASAKMEVATETNGSFPFPRLPRLSRTRSAGEGKGDEEGSSSSGSGSGSGNLVRVRSTGTGPRFARENGGRGSIKTRKELDMSHPVPRPESLQDAFLGSVNILLEEIHLDPSSSQDDSGFLALEGTFLVRNVAFEKSVFARFTTDDWATVNEVRGKWVGSCGKSHLASLASLNGLGLPIPKTLGDLIVAFPSFTDLSKENNSEWDRFTFRITLPPAVGPGRVVEFVGRFIAGNTGGEWWDNCGGKNWKVGLKEVIDEAPVPQVVASDVQKLSLQPLLASGSDVVDVAVPIPDDAIAGLAPTGATSQLQMISVVTAPLEYTVSRDEQLSAQSKIDNLRSGQIISSDRPPTPIKERAPKPTGLGSFRGLTEGGLFWPWRNVTNSSAESPKSAFSSSSSFGGSDSLNSLQTLNSLHPEAENISDSDGPSQIKLPASASVEVLSVIPPASSSPGHAFPRSPPAPPVSKAQTASRQISISQMSPVSSFESIDSMAEVPLLERSSSMSSVSTDGEIAELVEQLNSSRGAIGRLPLEYVKENGIDFELTPIPLKDDFGGDDAGVSDNGAPGGGSSGFFDRLGPGSGGIGVVTELGAAVERPVAVDAADSAYKAFIQQWCFAGSSSAPAPSKSQRMQVR